jgi:hypothetical protein
MKQVTHPNDELESRATPATPESPPRLTAQQLFEKWRGVFSDEYWEDVRRIVRER